MPRYISIGGTTYDINDVPTALQTNDIKQKIATSNREHKDQSDKNKK